MIAYIGFDEQTSEMIETIGEAVFLVDNASSFFTSLAYNRMFFDELSKLLDARKTTRRHKSVHKNMTSNNYQINVNTV